MVNVEELYKFLHDQEIRYFAGVPDSQLKPFCDYITGRLGIGKEHIIAANEGNAVALATGYHLATGKIGMVYMQNSGLGNAVNPITSLTDPEVYAVPVIYMIGWRGQPGVKDEPQHVKQGKITLDLLKLLGIDYYIISKETTMRDLADVYGGSFSKLLKQGKSVAFVVEKGGLQEAGLQEYKNSYPMTRERAIQIIASQLGENDLIISTTGKASRELFEFREKTGEGHNKDFLTVGSMGHASMIALSVAEYSNKKVWCLDGDGAVLMHTGGLATIGKRKPVNLYHILLNNGAHESVGGMPTFSYDMNWQEAARAFGYKLEVQAKDEEGLLNELQRMKGMQGPILLEVFIGLGSREDLIRPTIKPSDNKKDFMWFIDMK